MYIGVFINILIFRCQLKCFSVGKNAKLTLALALSLIGSGFLVKLQDLSEFQFYHSKNVVFGLYPRPLSALKFCFKSLRPRYFSK